jgi:cation:H+ antiporter
VIGISIVAIGTSLPELATSVVASYRGESDISVGNVIGSNIFNILLVLGIVAIIMPITVGEVAVNIDMWVMLAISIIIWPVMRTGLRINRVEGSLLLVGYVGYIIYLFMRTAEAGV